MQHSVSEERSSNPEEIQVLSDGNGSISSESGMLLEDNKGISELHCACFLITASGNSSSIQDPFT